MRKENIVLVIILSVCLGSCVSTTLQNNITQIETNIKTSSYVDSLNHAMEGEYEKGNLPGFTTSVFTSDSIYFTKGYGFSNAETEQLYTEHTIQGIASISKTLLSIVLMKAVERGIVSLDDEINTILPFPVSNPSHEDTQITLWHLATHTSSISDDGNYDKAYIFSKPLVKDEFPEAWHEHIKKYNKNQPIQMTVFLEKVFSEWKTEENFLPAKPGSKYEYSNIAAGLLGYCLELKIGKDYKELTKEWILDPLQMKNSGWDRKQLNQENHIIYYNESYNPVPNYEVITYPDGGLYSTAYDITIFLQDMIAGYQGKGKLLKPSSYATMMKNQIPSLDTATGIIWDLDISCCIGHGGNDFGTATLAYFVPESGIGKVLFTNITTETEDIIDQFYGIFNKMFTYDGMITKDIK